MKISSIRTVDSLKPVLEDQTSTDPDPVYWVFSKVSEGDIWQNLTVITPRKLGEEYPTTFGHYHAVQNNETSKVVSGEGVLQLQKKHFEGDQWVEDMVDEVLLVKAHSGDELTVTPEYAHTWSNIGNTPFITFDDWSAGHSPADYEVIERQKGLAYYLIEENGSVKTMPNPTYKNLPEPVWLTVDEYNLRNNS